MTEVILFNHALGVTEVWSRSPIGSVRAVIA